MLGFEESPKEKRVFRKVAIVTGAGSIAKGVGNGRAIAIQLAREGAIVIIVDKNKDAAIETKRMIEIELDPSSNNSIVIQADVTIEDDCRRVVKEVVNTYGKVDILINN